MISQPQATNDALHAYYQVAFTGSPGFRRAYIDADRDAATGFALQGIGADFLLENDKLYRHVGPGWNWQELTVVPHTYTAGLARWTVARADIGEGVSPNDADLVFQVEAPLETSTNYRHVYRDVDYEPSTATIANPERGFYRHLGDGNEVELDAQVLAGYREGPQKISLVLCIFYLKEFRNALINQAQLDRLQRHADAVRSAGLKMILRFAYTDTRAGEDAPLSRVEGNLDQLVPYLTSNSDVIAVMESGFVGAWGEGYYSQHFGNEGVRTETDWDNRKKVVDKILSVLPPDRMTLLRTPLMKRTMYGEDPMPPEAAYGGSAVARVGHHNDCFLASDTDQGTYEDIDKEYPYLADDTRYVAMGGETCAHNPPRSDCPIALDEMRMFHWSYLNGDRKEEVLASWNDQGCMDEVQQRLGYRFTLLSSSFPSSVTQDTAMPVQMAIKNEGWAAPYNPRPVRLVLRNTSTGAVHSFTLPHDARHWQADTTVMINHPVTIPPSVPAGTYALHLSLPDPMPSLSSLENEPKYAIQLANTGLWDPSTGFNSLLRTVTVQIP